MKHYLLEIMSLLKQALNEGADSFTRDQLELALEAIENILETE